MYSWDQKSLDKHVLNKRNIIQYQRIFILFKICLPKDFWSQLYIIVVLIFNIELIINILILNYTYWFLLYLDTD